MECPKVSIIMGIYNCSSTLDEAIESILCQTYPNWQMIMCDDSSTDNTYEIAEKYVNKYPDKFILINNEKNMGLNYTLNHCLKYADGEYIARMDGDDLSKPDRFEKEVSFLLSNPEYSIVSAQMEYFDEKGVFGKSSMKEKPEKSDLVKGTPFCHAPCMVKREAYEIVKGYSVDDKLLRAEDYELWVKMYSEGIIGYNLPDVLYSMRDDRNAKKRRKFKYRLNEAYVRYLAIKRLKLNVVWMVYAIIPVIKGFIPTKAYMFLHKVRMRAK